MCTGHQAPFTAFWQTAPLAAVHRLHILNNAVTAGLTACKQKAPPALIPHLLRTWPQFAMLHLLYKACGLRPPEQAAHIAQPGAKAHATHADATPKALGALHELVCVLGPLPVQGPPFASATAHVARGCTCACTLSAPRLCRQCT